MGVVGTAVVVGGAAHYGAKRANQQAASQDQAQQAAYEEGMAAAQQQAPAAAPRRDDAAAEIRSSHASAGTGRGVRGHGAKPPAGQGRRTVGSTVLRLSTTAGWSFFGVGVIRQ
jgi:hypothetical protein